MLHLLYTLYFKKFRNKRIDRLHHRIFAKTINILFPIYCKISHRILAMTNTASVNGTKQKYIVSLTTFPARIEKVWIAIESILRQSKKPDRIILWLAEDEFPDNYELPKNLTKLKQRGVEIRFCKENLMPHNKYYHTLKEFPEAHIITIDDDIIYPMTLIEKLIKNLEKYPDYICGTIVRKISVSKNNKIKPYKEWNYITENTPPSHNNLNMGVGGVLYPPYSLHEDVFDLKVLKKKCLIADDLWLKVMALKNNTKVSSLAGEFPRFFVTLRGSQKQTLMQENINRGGNDRQFQSLLKQYNISSNIFQQ